MHDNIFDIYMEIVMAGPVIFNGRGCYLIFNHKLQCIAEAEPKTQLAKCKFFQS